jgi:hypothetical protein
MRGIILRTALLSDAPHETYVRAPKRRDSILSGSINDLRRHAIGLERRGWNNLNCSFALCYTPPHQGRKCEYDLDYYHTLFDRSDVVELDKVPLADEELVAAVRSWTDVNNHTPENGEPGIVVIEKVNRAFYIEDHETGQLVDFITPFNEGRVQQIATDAATPFGTMLEHRFVVAVKLRGGNWQRFWLEPEPYSISSKIIG